MKLNKFNEMTVVIPVFNKDYAIQKTLECLNNQELLPEKVIVINDGSTDNSLDKIKDFFHRETINFNFEIINQSNKGVSATRNIGISMCETRYLALLDADDLLDKKYFKIRKDQIAHNSYDIYSGAHYLNSKKIFVPGVFSARQIINPYIASLFASVVNSSKVIFDLKKIDKMKIIFPEDAQKGEDLYLWLKLFRNSKIFYDPNPLVSIHVLDDKSRSSRKNKIPYPLEHLEHFVNDGIYCNIMLHAILIKHIRDNLTKSSINLLPSEVKNFAPYLGLIKNFLPNE